MDGEHKTRIVLADEVVAYLPLWLADDLKPWLNLEQGGRLEWRDAFSGIVKKPPPVLIGRFQSEKEKTGDRGCLNSVLEAWKMGEPCIGICDPCEIPILEGGADLVIVGGLIGHACFWCLAHPSIASAEEPSHLNAKNLIVHDAGFATGNYIGLEIAKTIRETLNPKLEIAFGLAGLVVDGAISLIKGGNREVAAISSSILSAALAHDSKDLEIAFPIHGLPEFNNFLTTGIVVHRRSLDDPQFCDRVRLLLFGIMFAQRYMANTRGEMIEYICSLCNRKGWFDDERQLNQAKVEHAKVVQMSTLATSLEISRDAAEFVYNKLIRERNIYCVDCEITSEQWDRGWFGSRKNNLQKWPPLSEVMDDRILMEAQKNITDRMSTDSLRREHESFTAGVDRSIRRIQVTLGITIILLIIVLCYMSGGTIVTAPTVLLGSISVFLLLPKSAKSWIGRVTGGGVRFLTSGVFGSILTLLLFTAVQAAAIASVYLGENVGSSVVMKDWSKVTGLSDFFHSWYGPFVFQHMNSFLLTVPVLAFALYEFQIAAWNRLVPERLRIGKSDARS